MNRLGSVMVGAAALAVAGTAYSAGIEVRRWTLRQSTLPVLPVGAAPLRILHISDLHMTPNQRFKQRWLAGLVDLEPDLVVNTGDNLAHRRQCRLCCGRCSR
jgi:predicted MPP superfamily phosphohydrolase